MIENCYQLPGKKKDLTESITKLERYLNNNQSRIDYQSYLKGGNRRFVRRSAASKKM